MNVRFSWKGNTHYPEICNTASVSVPFNIFLPLMSLQKLENATYVAVSFLVFLETLFDTKYQNPIYLVTSSKVSSLPKDTDTLTGSSMFLHLLRHIRRSTETWHFSAEFISLVTRHREAWKLLFYIFTLSLLKRHLLVPKACMWIPRIC